MKRDLILFITASLDGKIAGPNGEIDWLFHDQDYGYQEFIDSVDTVIMGRKTYELTLKFGDYPYKEMEGYIYSNSKSGSIDAKTRYTAEDPKKLNERLKAQKGKNIWLFGGTETNRGFIDNNLIDEYRLYLHPIVLGKGIELFPPSTPLMTLEFIETKSYSSGMVQLVYRKIEGAKD